MRVALPTSTFVPSPLHWTVPSPTPDARQRCPPPPGDTANRRPPSTHVTSPVCEGGANAQASAVLGVETAVDDDDARERATSVPDDVVDDEQPEATVATANAQARRRSTDEV